MFMINLAWFIIVLGEPTEMLFSAYVFCLILIGLNHLLKMNLKELKNLVKNIIIMKRI